MHPELKFQAELAEEYKYKPLSKELSDEVRTRYFKNLPECWNPFNITGGKEAIYSLSGTLIAKGHNGLIIGDYGAFIEIPLSNMIVENIKVKEGQEFRYDEKYKTCKYYWLTAKDNSDVKIYHQKGTVSYANYKVGMYYISPYEVNINDY